MQEGKKKQNNRRKEEKKEDVRCEDNKQQNDKHKFNHIIN